MKARKPHPGRGQMLVEERAAAVRAMRGQTAEVIAARLGLTSRTVERYRARERAKV